MQYEIKGGQFPVVICQLQDGETMITERGSMVWMTPNLEMQTSGGGLGRMFSRAISGESMFQNRYTARGAGMIAFGSSFPGKFLPLQVDGSHRMILQKSAFLAAEEGVELSIHFNKKLGAGFFGGEGFIMQKLSGRGMAFAEVDGELVLMEIHQVPGLKNKLLGGEGIFNTTLTGPGSIWLQTMPISSVAGALLPFLPKGNA